MNVTEPVSDALQEINLFTRAIYFVESRRHSGFCDF